MKRIWVVTFIVGMCSMWGAAQKPQTTVQVVRPSTALDDTHPQTRVFVVHPATDVKVEHPTTPASLSQPQTTVSAVHPATTVEALHPQTFENTPGAQAGGRATSSAGKAGSSTLAKSATSMSDFKSKQAKSFATPQKAASIGGGENKLGNATNESEKDAANKDSVLGKRGGNLNMNVDPNARAAALNTALENKTKGNPKK